MSINWKNKISYFGDGIQTDSITAITSAGVELNDTLYVDTIEEKTASTGTTINGVKFETTDITFTTLSNQTALSGYSHSEENLASTFGAGSAGSGPDVAVYCTRIGSLVSISIAFTNGASTTSNYITTDTGIPARFRPSLGNLRMRANTVSDSEGSGWFFVNITTAGIVSIHKNNANGSLTTLNYTNGEVVRCYGFSYHTGNAFT